MKHPDREEWIPFIFDEADAARRQKLTEHLAACPECAREIEGWRRSLHHLDSWPAPEVQHATAVRFNPLFKWALAAALVLGLGFLMGRGAAGPAVNTAELRAEVEASVRASLQTEVRQALQELRTRHATALTAAETRLNTASALEVQRIWRSMLDVLGNARAEDARAVQALLRQAQDRHDAEFVALRKDLETLASMTDEEIRQARLKLIQLADNQNTTD